MGLIVAHECCHMLGLVEDNNVLGGVGHHNPDSDGNHIMDKGEVTTYEQRFGREGSWGWRELNERYLRFILPKEGEGQ